MDFTLSEHHELLRQTVREFARAEVAPYAQAWDKEERFPKEIVPKLAAMGLLGIRIPEEYGGSGMDMTSYAICVEEIARVDGSLALTVASHNGLGTGHILAFGNEEQKRSYLPKAATRRVARGLGATEPGSGSDSAALATTARRDGDDWVLNGTKMFITQGSVGGFCVVLARTNPDVGQAAGDHGVRRRARDARASRASKHLEKLGCRSSDTVRAHVRGRARRPTRSAWARSISGFADTMRILDRGRDLDRRDGARPRLRRARDGRSRYAKDRKQFGKPIAEFQAIQWMLADAKTELDAAALLTYRAAWLADQGKRYSEEASMAKLFASEAATARATARSRSTAATATRASSTSSATCATPSSARSAKGTSEVQRMVIAKHLLRADSSLPPTRPHR